MSTMDLTKLRCVTGKTPSNGIANNVMRFIILMYRICVTYGDVCDGHIIQVAMLMSHISMT